MASVIAPPSPTSPSVSPQKTNTLLSGVERYRFTVAQYHDIIKQGIFSEDEPVELIRGEIVKKMAIGISHAFAVNMLTRLLSKRIADDTMVSIQNPVLLSDSEPEPDVAVLKFVSHAYASCRPIAQDVLLLIEVADTSLNYDRDVKGRIYAESGIQEYWIVNLINGSVEVYRDPQSDGRFATSITVSSDGVLTPLLLTDVSLRVDEIMTPAPA